MDRREVGMMDRKALEDLARERDSAHLRMQSIGMTNTVGLSLEAQVDLDVAYQTAKDDFFEKDRAYRAALTK